MLKTAQVDQPALTRKMHTQSALTLLKTRTATPSKRKAHTPRRGVKRRLQSFGGGVSGGRGHTNLFVSRQVASEEVGGQNSGQHMTFTLRANGQRLVPN